MALNALNVVNAVNADDGGFGSGVRRVKRRLDSIREGGVELKNPWPGLMHADDALQALREMQEVMLLDGEVGEGGHRLNPMSGKRPSTSLPGPSYH